MEQYKKKHLLGFLFILIITPVICNIMLGCKNITNIETVGKPTDWLVFYGSYLGAVISAIVAFYILCVNRNDTRKQIEDSRQDSINLLKAELKHKEIYSTVNELADRFSKFTPLELIRLSEISKLSQQTLRNEITYLQSMHSKYIALSYSATLLYKVSGDDCENIFFEAYHELICHIVSEIDATIKDMSKYLLRVEDSEPHMAYYQSLIKDLEIRSVNLTKLAIENEKVLGLAEKIIAKMQQQYKKEFNL